MVFNHKLWFYLVLTFSISFPFLFGQSGYFLSLFILICILSIASMSLNLLVGFGGQVSVGNAGFLMIGSYTVAILSNTFQLPFWLLLPLAGVITGIIGLAIGIPAVRLSGHFLAVATLGFGISIPQIALNWDSVTNGYAGLSVSRPAILSSDLSLFYFIVFMTIAIFWFIKNIVYSPFGRAFIAIRDSEVAAQTIGINISFYKAMMFAISAFFTGISGGLYAYWYGFVSPNDFSIMTSLLLLAGIIVGGLASIPGAIIGAVFLTLIPHFTAAYNGMTNIVIGSLVILIIMFKPDGIVHFFDFLKKPVENKAKEQIVFTAMEGGTENAKL
ncbi:branched-chain amino acid ABC transporter permease [Bacillus sp. P2(2020)]|uniref:Branched-chain amino acid ABC transporter permease n=1 Tax=Calidifontibacillus erzurumensis TaxID=2741433 RepID=A0A8J8KAY0_9BACI|nr:branched-chain amino acid ABC transporter permease [Calidifontibacillus erzurumensis]